MNLLTLADARAFLRPFVDNGSCSVSLIDARIAEIEERLWPKADWRLSLYRVRVLIRNRQFVLPANVLKICAATVDGLAAPLGSVAYEFSSSGPGDADLVGNVCRNVIDAGEHATQYDIPRQRISESEWSRGMRLAAFSTAADDTVLSLTIRGFGANSDEVRTEQDGEMAPGEVLRVNRWHLGQEGQIGGMSSVIRTTSFFESVSRVYKPVSRAPITLYAIDESTGAMYMLAKMEPEITVPSYRRYWLTGIAESVAAADKTMTYDCSSATLLVKVGWVRATRASDVLAIQNLAALKFGAFAITAENAGDYNGSVAAWQLAENTLREHQQDRDGQVSLPSVWDVDVNVSNAGINHGYLV